MTTSYPNTRAYAKTQKLKHVTDLPNMTTEPLAGGAEALNDQDLTTILNQVSENQLHGLRLLQEDNNKYFSAQLDKFTEVITQAVPKPVVDKPSYGVRKPEAYGGQVTEDLNSWVEKFRSIAALNKWSEADKARLLQLYLTCAALTFYHTLPGPTKNHFDTAVEALRSHFDDGPARNALHITLHNLKQLPKETVSQYTDDLERQFVSLDIRKNYYKLLIFVEGLSAHLHAPSSFHSANQTSSRSNNRGNYHNFSNRGHTNFQNNRFQRNRLQNSQHNSYHSSPGVTICSRCHKRGHTAQTVFDEHRINLLHLIALFNRKTPDDPSLSGEDRGRIQ